MVNAMAAEADGRSATFRFQPAAPLSPYAQFLLGTTFAVLGARQALAPSAVSARPKRWKSGRIASAM